MMKKTLMICLAAVLLLSFTGCSYPATYADALSREEENTGVLSHEGYTLEQVVVLSRHNIRSPLSGGNSLLDMITPHEWFAWSSDPSDLSLRGGTLETEMGQYFRKWLEAEGFFPKNYRPEPGEVRVYANSKQRTIATARFFSAGLLPAEDTPVEYHVDFDTMDPVFTPQLTFVTEAYQADAEEQIRDLFTDEIEDLSDNYELLSDVIDMEDSEGFADGTVTAFQTDDSAFILEENNEPAVTGSLKTACSVSDALVLQYYEEPSKIKAGFGHRLTQDQWEDIAEIKDVYGDVLFTAPLVAINVAHPLLEELESELNNDGRRFSFLCGHDSNIGSVLAALSAEEYELPDAIEKKTPIGSKLVFGRWVNNSGEEFISLDLVYQSPEQLRRMTLLDLDNQPNAFSIALQGLEKNADGLYPAGDVMDRIREAIEDYDREVEVYEP